MTKKVVLSVLAILCVSMLGGCGEKTPAENKDIAPQHDVQEKPENEKSMEISYPLTLRVGYSTNSDDPRGVALQQFKEKVEDETEGNILIEIHSDGELGSDSELISGMISGDVDMTVSSAGNYASYATRIGISALPFLFSDFESAWEFIDSDDMQAINVDLEQFNMYVLSYFDNGFRCVTTSENVGPVESVEDMAGLNIRTPENQIIMETMIALSANPQSFPFAELKDALRDGQFDAQENPIPVIYNNGLYEVQKYLSVTNHSYDAMPLTIRNDIWTGLTDEYKQIISNAAKEASATNRQLVKKQTDEYVSLLEENGMEVYYPNIEEFRNATQSVIDVFSPIYGEDLIEKMIK